jgi:hypothetical protein
MSLAIVERIRRPYDTPLGALHGEFLIAVCRALNEDAGANVYGLYKKSGGMYVVLPDGTKVSQDIIVYRSGLKWWDILEDGENLAKPLWNGHTNTTPDDPATFYDVGHDAPMPPDPNPDPDPDPIPLPPVGPIDFGPVIAALKQLEEANRLGFQLLYDQQARDIQALTTQIAALPVPPVYETRLLNQTITSRPKK